MLHTSIPTLKPVLQGSVEGTLTFNVTYADTGIASGVKKCTLQASATKPMLVRVMVEIITAFNAATTNVLTVGTDTTATQFLGSGEISEGTAGGFYPINSGSVQAAIKRIVADTDIYVKYTQSGTAATTGAANVYVLVTPLDPYPTNTYGS